MSPSFVKVLPTNDDHWAVESNGERIAYASRGAAIAAASAISTLSLMTVSGPLQSRKPELALYQSRYAAIAVATALAKETKAELLIHGRDGQISECDLSSSRFP